MILRVAEGLYWGALGLVTLFWLLALVTTIYRRLTNTFRILPTTYPPEAAPMDDPPKVSVVIPARDEAANIRRCVESVLAQDYPNLEVVVLDDDSSDATPDILAELTRNDARVQVHGGSPLPDGWKGKCWALEQAQSHATGEWLLFVDADVVLQPAAIRQSMCWVTDHQVQMLSGFGRLVLGSFWERVVMPIVGGLIVAGNPLHEVNDPEHERVIANGQFILISRSAYDQIGRHATVAGEIIDDVALARAAKTGGVPYHMVFCRQLFDTRMYTSLAQIWEGWRKNLYAGVGYRPAVALLVVFFVVYTGIFPFAALAVPGPSRWLAVGCVALIMANRIYTAWLFEHPMLYAPTHPLGALIVTGIILDSAFRGVSGGKVTWKGRAYGADAAGS